MATPGNETERGRQSTTDMAGERGASGIGTPTPGMSPATTNAAMTGATPGMATNSPASGPTTGLGAASQDREAGLTGTASGETRTAAGQRRDQEQLRQDVRQTGETLKEEARRTAQALKDSARQSFQEVANKQKETAAGEISSLSRALRRAADELEGHSQLPVDRYIRRVAQSLDDLSQSLQQRDVGGVIGRLEQYAREQPVMVMGGALLAGFLVARMLRMAAQPEEPDRPELYH